MKIKIQLSNDQTLKINSEAIICAWKSVNENGDFHEKMIFNGKLSELTNAESFIGLMSLLDNSDWFALDDIYSAKYHSASVVKIELEEI